MHIKTKNVLSFLLISALATACSGIGGNGSDALTASGTISAKSVNIAAEIGGKVVEVFAAEGENVEAGEMLFRIDSAYLQSQYDQADAAAQTAEAALETATVQLESSEIQHQLTIQNARQQYEEVLLNEWRRSLPGEFELPTWYFTRDEEIETTKILVERSTEELTTQQKKLSEVLEEVENGDFIALEKELAEAQTTFLVADAALDAVSRASDNAELKDAAEDSFDLSESELDNVQERYDQALDTEAAEDVLEARAAVGAAQAAHDEAINLLHTYFIGDDSLAVQASAAAVDLAAKNVSHAKAASEQAMTALRTVEIQLEKTEVRTPIAGDVLVQNLEEGELVGAGAVVMTVGNIDEVRLTVFIPEDEYGQINLRQEVIVEVDSYPEKSYTGSVSYISDEAEFTPSNVQTVEGRKATVFAVEIAIPNGNHDLKPGMPADVTFIID